MSNEIQDLVTTDFDGDEIKIKPFYITHNFYQTGYNTLEEAQKKAAQNIKNNPYSPTTQIIVQVLSISKPMPKEEVNIQIIDVQKYYNSQQLEHNNGV